MRKNLKDFLVKEMQPLLNLELGGDLELGGGGEGKGEGEGGGKNKDDDDDDGTNTIIHRLIAHPPVDQQREVEVSEEEEEEEALNSNLGG